MKTISTLLASAGAWTASAATILAGELQAPAASSNNDGAVALFLILGALVVIGGIMKPKGPPDDQG